MRESTRPMPPAMVHPTKPSAMPRTDPSWKSATGTSTMLTLTQARQDSLQMEECAEPAGWENDKANTSSHDANTNHLSVLCQGFDILALAATFLSAIQAQVMSTTLTNIPGTTAIRAANAFYLSGLILDLIAACLAFLTSRWFQRLTNSEKEFLQQVFAARAKETSEQAVLHYKPAPKPSLEREQNDVLRSRPISKAEEWLIPWYSMSLFVPMLFLVLGALCMIAGIYTYTWSQHPLPVAIFVSIAGISTVPFIIGVFSIGRGAEKRKQIILRLSKMQGDW